jgi:hypothetical protein
MRWFPRNLTLKLVQKSESDRTLQPCSNQRLAVMKRSKITCDLTSWPTSTEDSMMGLHPCAVSVISMGLISVSVPDTSLYSGFWAI